jgi:hypothetical protein
MKGENGRTKGEEEKVESQTGADERQGIEERRERERGRRERR